MATGPRAGIPPTLTVRERVRWSDVDAAGILCYGAYLRFFEIAETELFRTIGLSPAELAERHPVWLVRRRVECDFLSPVRLDEELSITAWVAEVGRTSIELRFEVLRSRDGAAAAHARYVLVAVDRQDLRPRNLSAELVRSLRRGAGGSHPGAAEAGDQPPPDAPSGLRRPGL